MHCEITVSPPLSGKRAPTINWDAVDIKKYPVQSMSCTHSWGTEPAQANVVYLSSNAIQVGSACKIKLGQYCYQGICESDVPLVSSRGNTRQLTFRDYRKWLEWDKTYCAFNNIDDKLIGGIRQRRYWSILPNDFGTMRKTWSYTQVGGQSPIYFAYNAASIISLILGGPGVETPWTMAYLDNAGTLHQGFHPNLGYPVYNLDCLGGVSIGTVLSQICDQVALLFTLMPSDTYPFNLVFAMKGVDGPDVTMPADADDRQSGIELSGNPTRVRVLGDRNLYQVHDIQLVADWNTNYNAFYDESLFIEWVFKNCVTWNATTDPEQIIARQEARSLAMEMTLWQLDTYRGNTGAWLDSHKYCGRARNNMPVVLYIRNLLFRAFRLPTGFWFRNTYGGAVYSDSVEIQDKLLTKVVHDPVTGLSGYDKTLCVDGNAYVIVQGYQVGKDMFETIKPERFNITQWRTTQEVWQKIDVRIEDSGEPAGQLIIFDEPVIRSDDLVELVGGYAVFKANPTITVPYVRATLTFAAEKFSWFQANIIEDLGTISEDPLMGTQCHDEVLNIGGLNGEFVLAVGETLNEIYYADGKSCRHKACEFGNNFLKRQWLHARGSFKHPISEDYAWQLHGKIDRITLDHGPGGSTATVSLTNERGKINYVPERDLDRVRQLNTLLPGQGELRSEMNFAKKIAAAVKSSKDAYRLLSDAFHGNFTQSEKAKLTTVMPPQ